MNKESELKISTLPFLGEIDIVRQMAELYAHVFSLPPWNENNKIEDIVARFKEDVARENSVVILASNEQGPQGFIWGFGSDFDKIMNYMISTWFNFLNDRQKQTVIHETEQRISELGLKGLPASYISEIAVHPVYQGSFASIYLMSEMCTQQKIIGREIYISSSRKSSNIYPVITEKLNGHEVLNIGKIIPGKDDVVLSGKFSDAAIVLNRYLGRLTKGHNG